MGVALCESIAMRSKGSAVMLLSPARGRGHDELANSVDYTFSISAWAAAGLRTLAPEMK